MEKCRYIGPNVLRYTSLSVLTFQTTCMVLAMRYSRKANEGGKDLYIGTTMVLVSEILKFILCLLMLLIQNSFSMSKSAKSFYWEVIRKPKETVKLSIPSTLYSIQNNLILLALSNLDAATFQVTYQLKILTTAVFSVFLLRKEIVLGQWMALVILMLGVTFVQFPSNSSQSSQVPTSGNQLTGMLAVLASSFFSGFSGVFYEKLLKESSQPSVIIRNLQLGVFSVIFGVIGVVGNDWNEVLERGFFYGYTPIVWVVVLLQTTGGLLIAAVVKYADNILKGFATSVSIILSCLVSHIVFHDLKLETSFILGACMVIAATFLYGQQSHSAASLKDTKSSKASVGQLTEGMNRINWSMPNFVSNQMTSRKRPPAVVNVDVSVRRSMSCARFVLLS